MATQEPTPTTRDVFVGIDVSKTRRDVALRPGEEHWDSANEETGVAALVARLQGLAGGDGPQLVVLEATGGLERLAVAALALAGLPVAVVNPRQVRDARQGERALGQDRCAGCRGAGALCPGAAPRAAHAARPPAAGPGCPGGASAPIGGHADC